MLVVALLWLVLAFPVAMLILHRRSPLDRPAVLAGMGMMTVIVGIIMTPGIAWGHSDDHNGSGAIAVIVFWAGMAVLVWAAVARRRGHHSRTSSSN